MRTRIIMALGAVVAVAALVWGAMYDAVTTPAAPVLSGGAADGGGERGDDEVVLDVTPIEGWFPRTGVGSTCTEPVGVDLIPGYGAVLVINGQPIPDEQLNLYANPEAPAAERILTAEGALGHYTWGPEEDCPNGSLLRPENNKIEVCVYRIEVGPSGCTLSTDSFSFDAL